MHWNGGWPRALDWPAMWEPHINMAGMYVKGKLGRPSSKYLFPHILTFRNSVYLLIIHDVKDCILTFSLRSYISFTVSRSRLQDWNSLHSWEGKGSAFWVSTFTFMLGRWLSCWFGWGWQFRCQNRGGGGSDTKTGCAWNTFSVSLDSCLHWHVWSLPHTSPPQLFLWLTWTWT